MAASQPHQHTTCIPALSRWTADLLGRLELLLTFSGPCWARHGHGNVSRSLCPPSLLPSIPSHSIKHTPASPYGHCCCHCCCCCWLMPRTLRQGSTWHGSHHHSQAPVTVCRASGPICCRSEKTHVETRPAADRAASPLSAHRNSTRPPCNGPCWVFRSRLAPEDHGGHLPCRPLEP